MNALTLLEIPFSLHCPCLQLMNSPIPFRPPLLINWMVIMAFILNAEALGDCVGVKTPPKNLAEFKAMCHAGSPVSGVPVPVGLSMSGLYGCLQDVALLHTCEAPSKPDCTPQIVASSQHL